MDRLGERGPICQLLKEGETEMTAKKLKKRIDAAAGRIPADLVLKGGRLVNVFAGGVEEGDLAVADGVIVGIGHYRGKEEIDLGGRFVAPGLIDGHLHVESTFCPPAALAPLLAAHGTSAALCDPHEMANVCGLPGVEWMIRNARGAPVDFLFALPSCVPASPYEFGNAVLDGVTVSDNLDRRHFYGLGEMMDFPGVIAADPDILKKLLAADREKKPADGHAPGLSGEGLNAYLCGGIRTDHEASTLEEGVEKLARGMWLQIREGSQAKNLETLIPLAKGEAFRRCLFCSDDLQIGDILGRGHLDAVLKKAVALGLDPVRAVTMATLNPAECYGLKGRGALAPGYAADLVVFEDLEQFQVAAVFKAGALVFRRGERPASPEIRLPKHLRGRIRAKLGSLDLPLPEGRFRAISVRPGTLLTGEEILSPEGGQERFCFDPGKDLVKLVCLDRHRAKGSTGLGLLQGFGLKKGALAATVSHDAHCLIAAGCTDGEIRACVEALSACGGGLAAAEGENVKVLPLEIGGLMSLLPAAEAAAKLKELTETAHRMGVREDLDPFVTLSFLSLTVIPELKLTPRGYFDVRSQSFVPFAAG